MLFISTLTLIFLFDLTAFGTCSCPGRLNNCESSVSPLKNVFELPLLSMDVILCPMSSSESLIEIGVTRGRRIGILSAED